MQQQMCHWVTEQWLDHAWSAGYRDLQISGAAIIINQCKMMNVIISISTHGIVVIVHESMNDVCQFMNIFPMDGVSRSPLPTVAEPYQQKQELVI